MRPVWACRLPAVFQDGAVFFGDEEGFFYAVDIATGKARWTFESLAEILSSPNCLPGAVLFGSYDSNLYSLDPKSGKLNWSLATEDRVHCSPAIEGNSTFVAGCDGHLRVIDITKGEETKTIKIGDYVAATPSVVNGIVYIGTFGNQVLAIDWRKGEILWRYSHPETDHPFFASPAVVDGKVVIGGRDKRLHAIHRETGTLIWDFPTKGRVDSSPVVTGDVVYFGSYDGNLYAVSLADGEELWKFTLGGDVVASPAVVGNRLLISSRDNVPLLLAGQVGGKPALHKLHSADNADIVAIPQLALPDRHSVRQWVAVGQLDPLDDRTCFGVMLVKGIQVRVRDPEKAALPANAVGTVPGGGEVGLDDPVVGVDAVDHAGGGDSHPELPVAPLETVSAGAGRIEWSRELR